MERKKISIILPVCNEGGKLERCIHSINLATSNLDNLFSVYLCLNGCSDNSEDVAYKCKLSFDRLNINILHSPLGKLNAQREAIKKISAKENIIFMDSDTVLGRESLQILIRELKKHKELIAVGAFPMALYYNGNNLWSKVMDKILNIRSRYPCAEISKLDVSKYHKLAIKDPQNFNTNPKHELKSKIFFHGRLFMLRSKKYWAMPRPDSGVVGDDSFLPDYIIYNYGLNRIRIRYDSIIYYDPFTSLIKHYHAYKRIYYDLKNLAENYPQFKYIRDHSSLILDKDYIKKQNFSSRVYFNIFEKIRFVEKFLFRLSPKRDPDKIWISAKVKRDTI